MAAYITRQDLEQRFGVQEIADLLDDDADDSESTDEADTLTPAVADASNLIDAYIGGRYTLPLVVVPDLVKAWASDIARFKLWDKKAPEEVRKRYEDALAQLKLVSKGDMVLPPGSDGEPVVSSAADNITGYANCRLMTESSLAGF